jgi:hypothetical protein
LVAIWSILSGRSATTSRMSRYLSSFEGGKSCTPSSCCVPVGINHFRICNNNRKHLSLSDFARVRAGASGKA